MPKIAENSPADLINISDLEELSQTEKQQRRNLEACIKNGEYQTAITILAWLLSEPKTAPAPAPIINMSIKVGSADFLAEPEKRLRKEVWNLVQHRKYLEAKQLLENYLHQ